MTRRRILKYFLLATCLLPYTANAFSLPRIYGATAKPLFIQSLYRRFIKWMRSQWPTELSTLSLPEQQLLDSWLKSVDSWGFSPLPDHIFETFAFSFAVKNNTPTAPTLFIGHTHWPESLHPQLLKVAAHRGAHLTKNDLKYFYGFAWNFADKSFETHFLFPKRTPQDISIATEKVLTQHPPPKWAEAYKCIDTYTNEKKKISETIVFALSEIDYTLFPQQTSFDLMAAHAYANTSGTTEWKWFLRSLFLPLLSDKSHPLIQDLKSNFYLSPHIINYTDKNNFTLYYP